MKKTLIYSILLTTSLLSAEQQIDLSELSQKQSNQHQENTNQEKKQKTNNSMLKIEYSFLMPTQQKFLDFLVEAGIDSEQSNIIYKDCAASPKNAFICAMAYDHGYGKASDTIETYYKIAADAGVVIAGRNSKYEYADYKLRTNDGVGIRDYFSNGECYTKKQQGTCFYIIGMADYLTNKNCKFLNLAQKQGVKTGLINRLCGNGR